MNRLIAPLLTALLLGFALPAAAADAGKTGDGKSADADAAPAAQTDVIGSQEAPSVFNVVPWKDKPSRLPKKEVTTSILRETLQPLDPEVLRREIELQKRLGEQP